MGRPAKKPRQGDELANEGQVTCSFVQCSPITHCLLFMRLAASLQDAGFKEVDVALGDNHQAQQHGKQTALPSNELQQQMVQYQQQQQLAIMQAAAAAAAEDQGAEPMHSNQPAEYAGHQNGENNDDENSGGNATTSKRGGAVGRGGGRGSGGRGCVKLPISEDDPAGEKNCRNQTGYIGVRQRKWGMFAAEIRDGDKRRCASSPACAWCTHMAWPASLSHANLLLAVWPSGMLLRMREGVFHEAFPWKFIRDVMKTAACAPCMTNNKTRSPIWYAICMFTVESRFFSPSQCHSLMC